MSSGWVKGAFRVVCLVAVAVGLMSHFAFGFVDTSICSAGVTRSVLCDRGFLASFLAPAGNVFRTESPETASPDHAPAAAATRRRNRRCILRELERVYLRFYSPRSATMSSRRRFSSAGHEHVAGPGAARGACWKPAPHAVAAGATQIEWLGAGEARVNRVEVYTRNTRRRRGTKGTRCRSDQQRSPERPCDGTGTEVTNRSHRARQQPAV
jgi:hypothetical protein